MSAELKRSIMSRDMVAGAMVFEFFSPGLSSILHNAGAKFVIYDMEHTGLGMEPLKWLFASCRGLPIAPMVRVPVGEYTYLARALDLGAHGVMIPMVESAEHAKSIVKACRYPPLGRRGAAFGFAQCDYKGGDIDQKITDYHARTLVMAQIETERGLDNVEAIAAVDGIDVLWVGHFDLSNFMGMPAQFDNPTFVAAMKRVADVAKQHNKIAGFMATDACVSQTLMQQLARELAEGSFNRVTVDGDTSTNDSFVVIATNKAQHAPITSLQSSEGQALLQAMLQVARELAQAIVRDGEGATKFITIRVEGGNTSAECRQVAYAIAHSPLVKTAFFASDPNLGRILAAVGYAGITDLDQTGIDLYLDDVHVAIQGGRHPEYREEDGQRVMKQSEITVRVVLGRGTASDTVWTCDLSHDYVSINADYRS